MAAFGVKLREAAALSEADRTRLNEQRYRALVQSISTFTWVADAEGNFAFLQPGWEEYTGHGFAEHRGSGWVRDVHPDDRARVAEIWAQAVRTRSWYEVEWRCWHGPSQCWRRCVTRGVPILDPDGAVREWIGAVTDIEHRLSVDDAFQREWLRIVQSTAGLAMWECSPATGEARWTPELYRLYGVQPGTSSDGLDSCIHPEDRERVVAARSEAAITGRLDTIFRLLRPSGEVRWVRSKGGTVPNGGLPKMVGVLIDVTEQIEVKERFRAKTLELETLIDAIPACVWIARDPECNVIVGNRAANELLGTSPDTNVPSSSWAGVGEPVCRNLSADGSPVSPDGLPMQRVCRTGAALWDEEIRLRLRNGREVRMLGNVVPLFNGPENICGCVAVFVDITELKGVQQQLEQANQDLLRANEQLLQFNFAAGHDLREPLRQVAIYSELLQRNLSGKLDPESYEHLRVCREGAQRMEAMLNDLLLYAQTAGSAVTTEAGVDCRDAFEEARQNLRDSIAQSCVVIESGELPCVRVARSLLVQVFQNLLSNALKYRGAAAPHVRLSAVREGDFWTFSMLDNGIGIAPQYHQLIFGLFQRLHARTKYPGTGIGLALCKHIVERSGGRIWVDSEKGKGSAFRFTLPAAQEL